MRIWRSQQSLWLPPSAFERSASADRRSLGGGWSGGRITALAAVLTLLATGAEAGIRRIWGVNDGEKIERDAKNHPASARNSGTTCK